LKSFKNVLTGFDMNSKGSLIKTYGPLLTLIVRTKDTS